MTRWVSLSRRQLRKRSGKAPSKLQRGFFKVADAPHYAAACQAVFWLASELLRRGHHPELIAHDLGMLIQPPHKELVDEIVSACALRRQEARPR